MPKPVIIEGATATNPQTGQRIVYRGGSWTPYRGEGPQSGDTPMAPLTPGSESRTRLALGLGPAIDAQKQMYRSEQWNTKADDPRGVNPFSQHPIARALEAVPFDGGAAARIAGGQEYQDYEQAGKTFESAFLPILSGAAVTPSEAQRMIRANLPQIGDTPGTLAKKANNRAMMINAAADLGGRPRPFPKVGTYDLRGGSQDQPRPQAAPAEAKTQGAGWRIIP